MPTAAVVVEVVSPDDETFAKLPFYAGRGVDEVLVVEPRERRVRVLRRDRGRYVDAARSALLGVDAERLAASLDWPA